MSCCRCWSNFKHIVRQAYSFRQLLVVIFTPIVLLPIALAFKDDLVLKKAMQCAYVIAIMIVYWSTQAIPIAITALLPMVLYPLLSIAKASDVAPKYMGESNLAFIASVLVVETIDQVGLHKRLARAVLHHVGLQPRWILFGFMSVSAFMAMWLQNSVVTALMVPIVFSVTDELRKAIFGAWHMTEPPKPEQGRDRWRKRFSLRKSVDVVAASMGDQQFRDMLLLAIAYSASIGGVATLIGTSSNLIMKQEVDEAYESKDCTSPINFLSWMIYVVPISVVFLLFAWFMLLFRYYGPLYALGCRPSPIDKYREKIRASTRAMYEDLQPMGLREYVVIGHIVAMVLLMITRQLNTNPVIGWDLIAPGYCKESTSAVLVAISLYVFPISLPYRDESGHWHLPETAVDWQETARTVPLGVIILVGGGHAAAFGTQASGLAKLISTFLHDAISPLSDVAAMCILVVIIVYATEILSGTACVSIMMPVLRYLAENRGVNPLLYMFPTTIASSFGFMFPVATAPNAEVFHAGTLELIDMIAVGFFMDLLGIGLVIAASLSYGQLYFDFFEPPWIVSKNALNETTIDVRCLVS